MFTAKLLPNTLPNFGWICYESGRRFSLIRTARHETLATAEHVRSFVEVALQLARNLVIQPV